MAYLASSGLCIGAIACLSNQKTARTGNALGLMGVGGGIAATLGAIGGDAALYGQIVGKICCAVLCCCLEPPCFLCCVDGVVLLQGCRWCSLHTSFVYHAHF